ncbi:hypothetical protein Bca4012_051345 [Brassica carinata]
MSRLVYLVFLLAVAKASRNTLQQKTEVDAGKPKLAVDSGNNNNLRTILKCNFPPYGQDFQGKFATGRFTDGRVPSDFVAERLGIAKTIPAYLDPALKGKDLLKVFQRVVSLEDQLKYFQEYKEKIKAIVGEEKAKFMVENSLYLVLYNSTEYPDYLADMSSKFVKKLYGLGARRIAIFSAVPVGCLPSRRTLNGVKRKCSENLNKMALQFNAKLSPGLVALRKKSPGSKIVFVDVYDILHNMIENPKKYASLSSLRLEEVFSALGLRLRVGHSVKVAGEADLHDSSGSCILFVVGFPSTRLKLGGTLLWRSTDDGDTNRRKHWVKESVLLRDTDIVGRMTPPMAAH